MPNYQKAYYLKQLREFAGWNEDRYQPTPAQSGSDESTELSDESIVYLNEELVVAAGCFEDSDVIFDQKSREWEAFCQDVLKFAVPDWEAESARVREALARSESKSDQPTSDET